MSPDAEPGPAPAPVQSNRCDAHRPAHHGSATERLHDELHAIEALADEGAAILSRGLLGLDWVLDEDLAVALIGLCESIGRRADLIGRLL